MEVPNFTLGGQHRQGRRLSNRCSKALVQHFTLHVSWFAPNQNRGGSLASEYNLLCASYIMMGIWTEADQKSTLDRFGSFLPNDTQVATLAVHSYLLHVKAAW